jgi:hypothetical protein
MSRVIIDLRDALGRLDVLEVTIHQDQVECWLTDRCRGIFDRENLRQWLDTPDGMLSCDEMSWNRTDGGPVTVSIDGAVARWPLAEHVLFDLRSRL